MIRHKVSKTGDCRKLLGQPYGRNASSMTKIRSVFTLICCSLAGLKMSLRTGFCCRNVLAQDKIKVHRKLYLSLPRIGILGVPSPNCMLHLQFWDGALLPPAVLGWHLLTCKFFTPSHLQIFHLQYWDGAFSPAVFFWQIFHMQFWDGTVQGCQIHRKKNNQWNHGGFATTSTRLPLKMQNSPKTKMIKGIMV